MAVEKTKILGFVLELPAKQQGWFGQFGSILRKMGLIGSADSSSKTAHRIFISSIVLAAGYLSYVKSIATYALTFLGYIISVLGNVQDL